MKLTRERKVYVAILSAAGAIWGFDQFVLSGGPQGAHAGVVDQNVSEVGTPGAPPTASSPSQPAISRAAADRTPHPTLASRLESLSRSLDEGEMARAADGLFEQPSWARPPKETPKAAEAEEAPQLAFAKRHEVTAIMTSPKGLVVVSGRPMKIGESIDGYVLKAIEKDAATFVRDGVEARLKLARNPRSAEADAAPREAAPASDAAIAPGEPGRGE